MAFLTHPALRCPLDAMPLVLEDGSLICSNGHRYDIGKQGYANLLSVQHKRSLNPGDSKDMVSARQSFLSAGFYEPIAKSVMHSVSQAAKLPAAQSPAAKSPVTVLDAGCGEGYYLHYLSEHHRGPLNIIGFDISKWAVQRAARRCHGTWMVASNKNIPLVDSSVDVVLEMFGFPDYASFERILAPGGRLIRVTPAPQHLIELRRLIYPQVHQMANADRYPSSLHTLSSEQLAFNVELEHQSLKDLLLMTPHMFKTSMQGQSNLERIDHLTVTVDVVIDTLVCTES
ncbi:MAG: methyltransferase domain-containing protein [Halieaceae bacterium]|jgi:23S rRNA (guanine745-N1)-methyltransferase|nr:methyltransferase domain-containing protein [Halieaceae bacterium]MBT5555715.1 methyltransferase domain-containing protein [Halieaceae bacterium]MBT6182004.1 methyltransferase domain-containing protein [Halieaceae bacterium]